MKTIYINLSVESVKAARDDIQDIKAELEQKNVEFIKQLADEGISVIRSNVASAMGADDKNVDITTELEQNGSTATMIIHVEGKDILFIEYGAGIHFNNGNFHPWANEYGYGVGTFPGQTHALDPNGWFYRDSDNHLHHSYGTQATMPVYKAFMSMQQKAEEVAKRVFNG